MKISVVEQFKKGRRKKFLKAVYNFCRTIDALGYDYVISPKFVKEIYYEKKNAYLTNSMYEFKKDDQQKALLIAMAAEQKI